MKEIFIARNALEACLISSALLVLVTMMGGEWKRDRAAGWHRALVVAAIGERRVDLAQNFGGSVRCRSRSRCGREKGKSVTAVPSRRNSGLEATSKQSGSAPLRRMICGPIRWCRPGPCFSRR
jgi:hypothetical protein